MVSTGPNLTVWEVYPAILGAFHEGAGSQNGRTLDEARLNRSESRTRERPTTNAKINFMALSRGTPCPPWALRMGTTPLGPAGAMGAVGGARLGFGEAKPEHRPGAVLQNSAFSGHAPAPQESSLLHVPAAGPGPRGISPPPPPPKMLPLPWGLPPTHREQTPGYVTA